MSSLIQKISDSRIDSLTTPAVVDIEASPNHMNTLIDFPIKKKKKTGTLEKIEGTATQAFLCCDTGFIEKFGIDGPNLEENIYRGKFIAHGKGFVTDGRSFSLDSTSSKITGYQQGVGYISIDFTTPDFDIWSFVFSTGGKQTPFRAIEYKHVQNPDEFEDTHKAGLDISGDGRGCNVVTGEFAIEKIVYSDSQIQQFIATFRQYCDEDTNPTLGRIELILEN